MISIIYENYIEIHLVWVNLNQKVDLKNTLFLMISLF